MIETVITCFIIVFWITFVLVWHISEGLTDYCSMIEVY